MAPSSQGAVGDADERSGHCLAGAMPGRSRAAGLHNVDARERPQRPGGMASSEWEARCSTPAAWASSSAWTSARERTMGTGSPRSARRSSTGPAQQRVTLTVLEDLGPAAVFTGSAVLAVLMCLNIGLLSPRSTSRNLEQIWTDRQMVRLRRRGMAGRPSGRARSRGGWTCGA